jgi:hypothetical protein
VQNFYVVSDAKFLRKKKREEEEDGATPQSVDRGIQVHPLATIYEREL